MTLAGEAPVTIVSADSRQVYRRFDVGTAKPTAEERAAVPHTGIDVVDPTERYSAFAWAEAAESWVREARAAGRQPVIVGGTGLYLRALFEPGFVEPPLDPARRLELQRALETMPTEELRRWVERLDPARSHLGRVQLLRSVEIALLTGERLSDLHERTRRTPVLRPRYLVVDPGASLGERIAERARAMLRGPWQDEVRELAASVPEDAPAWKSSGYRVVRDLVRGRLTLDTAIDRVVIETRQYAKRQRTWFRHQLPPALVTRLDPTEPEAVDVVRRWWGEGDAT